MSSFDDKCGQQLKKILSEKRGVLVPGASNALAARIIADLGFEALYLSGAGLTNSYFGIPDLGFVGLQDIAHHTQAIRDVVDLPLIVDVDTGFGNAVNVVHTVRVMERSGANAIQIEDQTSPKKCGHFNGKDVVPLPEMLGKIHAAVDTRKSENFLIIARTDARSVEGFEAAMDRAEAFIEAGADVTFVEATENMDELRAVPQRLRVPQVINLVLGGKTPIMEQAELADMGYSMILYANAALQGAISGMQATLGDLKKRGRLDEQSPGVAAFTERQRLVDKPTYDELEARYGSADVCA